MVALFDIFGPNGLALALIIAAITQVFKELTGWEGKKARGLALVVGSVVGVMIGVGALQAPATAALPDLPVLIAAGFMGLLLGVIAAGGYGLITWLQDRGVKQRIDAEKDMRSQLPAPTVQVQVTPTALPEAPEPAAPPPVPDSPAAPDPRGAEIEALDTPSLDVQDLPVRPLGLANLGPEQAAEAPFTHPAFSMDRAAPETALPGPAEVAGHSGATRGEPGPQVIVARTTP